MLSHSVSRAFLGIASPSPSFVHGMRRTMLSMARAYASPSSVSSDRNAETAVVVEVEVEELLVTESDESEAWIKDDTRERAEAKGVNDSSGYPLLHSELSAAMLKRPNRREREDEDEEYLWWRVCVEGCRGRSRV
jgi:hypothetical protein